VPGNCARAIGSHPGSCRQLAKETAVPEDTRQSSVSRPKRPRRRQAGREDLFALVAELHCGPKSSLADLTQNLDLSPSTIKRMLRALRRQGVSQGRLGTSHLALPPLAKPPNSFCCALVGVNPDVQALGSLRLGDSSVPYRTEEALLHWLSMDLPRTDPYRGKILVSTGHIVMGDPDFGLVLIVYAISTVALFEFVRLGVERAYGVTRTRTLMIAHSLGG